MKLVARERAICFSVHPFMRLPACLARLSVYSDQSDHKHLPVLDRESGIVILIKCHQRCKEDIVYQHALSKTGSETVQVISPVPRPLTRQLYWLLTIMTAIMACRRPIQEHRFPPQPLEPPHPAEDRRGGLHAPCFRHDFWVATLRRR